MVGRRVALAMVTYTEKFLSDLYSRLTPEGRLVSSKGWFAIKVFETCY